MAREVLTGPCSAAGRGGDGGDGGGDQDGGARLGYLAQHELFDQIPALRRDIVEPDFCRLGSAGRAAANAWFGPPGTVSGPPLWESTPQKSKSARSLLFRVSCDGPHSHFTFDCCCSRCCSECLVTDHTHILRLIAIAVAAVQSVS